MPKAFSYLEIVIVIAILAIFGGMTLLYGQTSQVRADVNAESGNLASYLRLAQSQAMSGEGNSDHGVHLEADKYILFEGSSYTPGNPANYEIRLPNTLEITNLNLNGGGNDVIFTIPKGETTKFGSFDLSSAQINKTVTFNITRLGTINY